MALVLKIIKKMTPIITFCSADLNPIEYIWADMKKFVASKLSDAKLRERAKIGFVSEFWFNLYF